MQDVPDPWGRFVTVAGLLLSGVALALLVLDEYHLAAVLIVLLLGGAAGRYLHLNRTRRYRYVEGDWYVEFRDAKGDEVFFRKTNTIVPTKKDLTFFDDTGYFATGDVQFVRSNMGLISEVRREGGMHSAKVSLPGPLQKGRKYHYMMEGFFRGSFLGPREDFLSINRSSMRSSVHMVFHEDRTPTQVRVAYRHASRPPRQIHDFDLSPDRRSVHVNVRRPAPGSSTLIEWDW